MKNLAAALFAFAAGCTDSAETSFHVQGRVADPAAVTDVVATTPSHIAASRVSAPIGRDGSFELALQPGHAWVLSFADGNQTGAAMLVGTLQAGSLDELAPRAAGSVDLGTVTMTGPHRASPTIGSRALIDALGMDEVTAARLGASDDLATRYANPDVDGNGVIDALEDGHDFRLDLYAEVHPTAGGRDLTIDDLVRHTATTGVRYLGTGIQASAPSAMMTGDLATATVTFEQPFYGSVDGLATAPVDANTPVGQPHVKAGMVEGYPTMGVFGRPGADVPYGAYQFAVGGSALTFVDVRTPADAELAAGTGMVAPFLHIIPRDASCVTDCTIDRVEYSWMRQTADGWQPVVPGELATMRAPRLEIVATRTGAAQYLGYDLSTEPTGSFAWQSMPASASGITVADLAGVTTGQICYFAVSYDDEIGMRMTSYVASSALACGGL